MPRYQPGSLEEAIKNLCYDSITEALSGGDNNDRKNDSSNSGQQGKGSQKKGRVTNPDDKRLKQNRDSEGQG